MKIWVFRCSELNNDVCLGSKYTKNGDPIDSIKKTLKNKILWKKKKHRFESQAKPFINRIGAWRSRALVPCWSWWKINPTTPKNHLHVNTFHKKRKAKAMEAGIPKSTNETFLMRKKRDYYYQKWINKLQRDKSL